MKKKWISCFLLIVLIGAVFWFRQEKSLYQMMGNQLPEALVSVTFWKNGESERVCIDEDNAEAFFEEFREKVLVKDSAFDILPDSSIEIVVRTSNQSYNIVIGKDNTICVADYENLEGTRTFWKDKSNQIYDRFVGKINRCK